MATICLGVLVTSAAMFLLPRQYTSQSSFLLRLGRENLAVDPTVVSEVTLSPDRKRENEVNSEVQILKSVRIAQDAVARLGPDTILSTDDADGDGSTPVGAFRKKLQEQLGRIRQALKDKGLRNSLTPEQQALRKIQKSFVVRPVRNSEVIELEYRHADGERARQVLETLLDLYLDRHIDVRKTPGAIEFFEVESGRAERELTERENILTRYRSENEIHSIKSEREILLQKIADVNKEVADYRGWVEGESKRRERFLQEYEIQPERLEAEIVDGKPNYGLTPVYSRLVELTVEESSLSSRFNDSYPPLVDTREQIESLKGFLDQLPSTLTEDATRLNQVRINLNSEIVHSEAKLSSLNQRLGAMESFLSRSEDRLAVLMRLEAQEKRFEWEVELARRRLSKGLSDLDQAKMSSALDLERISNISIIDPPTSPIKPEGPSRLALLLGGLAGTVLLSMGLALIQEYADRTFKSPEEISEMMQLPTLATVRRGHGLETFAKI